MTKEVDQYRAITRTAIAAQMLKSAGVRLHPGARISYLLIYALSRDEIRRVGSEGADATSKYDVAE